MRRRGLGLAVLVAISVGSIAPSAGGWSNGADGPNSVGTHDWLLKKAIGAAGDEASWVRVRVALRATDDPDTKDGIDHASGTWWHVYDRWGDEWGGADEAAGVWFRRSKQAIKARREGAASKALGYLAHIVSDVAQPMHTDSSNREDRVHSSYESVVDRRIPDYPFRYDGGDRARPISRTRQVGRAAHKQYRELVRVYDRHGYSRRAHRITKRQLKRAVNALADLINSIG